MALGDIWRTATTVRTFNDITPGEEKFFTWVVVTHYETTVEGEDDDFAALALMEHQTTILDTNSHMFAGNTRIVHLKAENLTSENGTEQTVNFFIGDEEQCLPAQVAIAVYARGNALGRRAMKYYGSLALPNLGANGLLDGTFAADAMPDHAFSTALDLFGGEYEAIIFGPTETPAALSITRLFASPGFRTQRRRVLTMTKAE